MTIRLPIYDYRTDTTSWLTLPDGELWVCGNDFCDRCGDCMACFGGDACYGGGINHGEHLFVVYKDQLAKFMERHPKAVLEADKRGAHD